MKLHSFVFFFQAEDGIRDIGVTGVQTCALPICFHDTSETWGCPGPVRKYRGNVCCGMFWPGPEEVPTVERSEERRVGKECRSRWRPDHIQKRAAERERSRVHGREGRRSTQIECW